MFALLPIIIILLSGTRRQVQEEPLGVGFEYFIFRSRVKFYLTKSSRKDSTTFKLSYFFNSFFNRSFYFFCFFKF